MNNDFKFDDFNDGAEKIVGEELLTKFSNFINQYEKQLKSFQETLDDTLSEVWNLNIDPVSLYFQPYEQTNIFQLIKTDNKVFNKLIITLSSLCLEVQRLIEIGKNKFYAPLKLFGEISSPISLKQIPPTILINNPVKKEEEEEEIKHTTDEGDGQVQFGQILNLIGELQYFIERCNIVVKNIIQQLSSFYNSQQNLYNTIFKIVHFQTVFEYLSDLFIVLMTLDEIIATNENLTNSLNMYKRMLKAIKSDPPRYNMDEEKLWNLEKCLYNLKGLCLDGRIFQNCIEQEYDSPPFIQVIQNNEFKKEFFVNIKFIFSNLISKIGEQNETNQRYKFMGLCGLYVMYMTFFKDHSDKKFFKQIWEVHKKIPVLHLYGDVVWFPTDFIRKSLPIMIKASLSSNLIQSIPSFQKEYIKQLDKDFINQVNMLYLQSSLWMVRMESNLTNRAGIHNIIDTRIHLLIQGIKLLFAIGNLFKESVSLHLFLGVALKMGYVRYLCQCIEMIKAIQATFHRRSSIIADSISPMIQFISSFLQKSFFLIKSKLESNKKYNDTKLDILAAISLALQMLGGCGTKERRIILKLCSHIILQNEFVKEEELDEVRKQLQKLEIISDIQELINSACDCSFMYWSRSMLPTYFTDIYEHPYQANKLYYIFAALRDIVPIFNQSLHQNPQTYINSYASEIYQSLYKHIIQPLCRDIETDLRFHIHSHLEVSERNPWKNGVKDLIKFMKLSPLRFNHTTIDIKAHVAHYLDTTFYNLTTVSLNNWKTYEEMRNLAKQKYDIPLMEVYLPGQTLEQGIDVLEIMRNIHVFVARYHYNLNNQIFVEKSTDNKTINIINIGHISNSIRTHGIGIMNTTVNFIYQFLRQKFIIFSQFLFDDYIKSRLFREIRFFKENKDQLDNKYPFERAKQFNKEIRKLGLNDQKLSYLDQFRNLITEIGNAMGYIRMIRSGGFNYVSNAIKFVPDLQNMVNFHDLVEKDKLSNESQVAAKNLDNIVECLSGNFSSLTEYFSKLVEVFAEEFRSAQNIHLKNFYIIIPPLSINFVDYILQGKDKLSKKKTSGGFFTDDGFAIGIAYILKLLEQNKLFDSLHWFEEVNKKYTEEQKKIHQQMNKQKKEDQQTAVLSIQKLKSYQMEFELLRYTLDGARIFFKS